MVRLFGNHRNKKGETEESARSVTEPARPSAPTHPIGFETVFGKSSTVEGKFTGSGNIRMDGVFRGALEISGNILVGESAEISADIDAHNISVAGAVRGNVTGNKVQLLQSARVWGDIHANTLTIEEGAFVEGKITMVGHTATPPPEAISNETEAPPPIVRIDESKPAENMLPVVEDEPVADKRDALDHLLKSQSIEMEAISDPVEIIPEEESQIPSDFSQTGPAAPEESPIDNSSINDISSDVVGDGEEEVDDINDGEEGRNVSDEERHASGSDSDRIS